MDQRISLITLGVADVAASRSFYERLGWRVGMDLAEPSFFQAGGMIFSIWGRKELAADGGLADAGGWGGVTLSHNVESPEAVDRLIEEARTAGARVTKEAVRADWGGYTGVFVDPDGHPWEIAFNPSFPLGEDGSVRLPGQ